MQSYLFYKVGQLICLNKIPAPEFEKYMAEQPAWHQKQIIKKQAKAVVQLLDNKPYYVQQLAFLLFKNSSKKTVTETINAGLQALLTPGCALYQHLF